LAFTVAGSALSPDYRVHFDLYTQPGSGTSGSKEREIRYLAAAAGRR
jgi:hypothetical protein